MYEEKEIKYKKRKKQLSSKKAEIRNKVKNIKWQEKKKEILTIPPILTNIDYKLLFFKIFILLLAMMLIIFTIARIKKHNEMQNTTLNTNINQISEATIQYYKNNPLPINIGDSSSFILEEMKNLNLIEEIKDEEHKFCNYIDSYIIFTKISNAEYRLKIYLKCPSKEKMGEEKIICQENNCNIKK